ncbi:MAG: DUF502 domain-containing protein [Candidatus Omnitrophota bacterium]|nr:DUF502 domain-containing protein [Candidatus Omnitrophota bacterium]
MWRKLRAYFFTGLLIIVPSVITFWVLYFIIAKLNFLLLEPLTKIFGAWIPDRIYLEILTKLVIVIIVAALLVLIGFAGKVIVIRRIFRWGERVLYKVPIISPIYKSIRDMSNAFFSEKNPIFKRTVLIEYPRNGIYSIGFVTSEAGGEPGRKAGKDVVNVFVPTSPTPGSGFFVIVPRDQVIQLDMSVTDGIKMVISGGAVVPGLNYGNTKDRSDTVKKEGLQGN